MGASAVPVRGRMTVEEFYQIPDSERKFFELVDGELVRTPMAHIPGESTRENLIFAIAGYLNQDRIGRAPVELDCQFKGTVRRPDLCFIPNELWIQHTEGAWPGAPPLVVEVAANDNVAELAGKIRLYLDNGATVVWVLIPSVRAVWVFRPGGQMRELRDGQYLEEPALLPGFRVAVSDLFTH